MKHIYIISSFLLSCILSGCVKDPDMGTDVKNAKVPTVNSLLDDKHPIVKTATTITFDAEVTNANGLPVERFGICWGEGQNPTIENNDTTVCGKGIGQFKGTAKGLFPEKEYFIRPYATNAKGTSYGEEFRATTNRWSGTVQTLVLTDSIKAESGYFGGKIILHGEGTIKERGICLTTPTTKDSIIPIDMEADSFVCKVTKLKPVTDYTVCAYATNEFGTYKGVPVEFKTTDGLATITSFKEVSKGYTDASFEAEVQREGDVTVTARGLCWGAVSKPTIEAGDTTKNGVGKGKFIGIATKLKPSSQYYIRAYATNAFGTAYSEEIMFFTKSATPRISAVTITSTNIGGSLKVAAEVLDEGESEITESGISYSQTPDDKLGNTKLPLSSGKGTFEGMLTRLKGGAKYYIKAYATNVKGTTTYGEETSYSTPAIFTAKALFNGNNQFGLATATATMSSSGFILGGDAGTENTNEFWAYRADRNEWLQLNSFPAKRKWQTAVSIGLSIVAFGGNENTLKNDLYIYNTITNLWGIIKTPIAPDPRSQALGFEYNGDICLIGGLKDDVTDEVWTIKPEDGKSWTKATTNFPVPQCRGIAVVIDDKIYAGLGVNKSNVCNKKLWVSSGSMAEWKELSPINTNVRCGVAYKGNIYVIDESGYIWMYDVTSNVWTKKSQMPNGSRDIYCMYSLNGLIYLTQGTANSPIISYDPSWDN